MPLSIGVCGDKQQTENEGLKVVNSTMYSAASIIQHYAHLAEQHFEAPDFNIDSGTKQQLSGDDVQTCRARQVHKFPKGAKC